MKISIHSFSLLSILSLSSCFALSDVPFSDFSDEGLQSKEPISHIYINVKRTVPLLSSYNRREGLTEFHYKYNEENDNIFVKTLVPTGLSEGFVIPTLKIQVDDYSLEITGEVLAKELLLVGDEENFNQYFTICSFELTQEDLDKIRNSEDLTFILDTEYKERIFVKPFEKQVNRIKGI
jgi:hypothetical protein